MFHIDNHFSSIKVQWKGLFIFYSAQGIPVNPGRLESACFVRFVAHRAFGTRGSAVFSAVELNKQPLQLLKLL